MRKIVRLKRDGTFALDLACFRHHREQIAYRWSNGCPQFQDLFSPALEDLLGPRRMPDDPLEDRHRAIARSVQVVYEEAFFHLLRALQQRTGLTDIALAGGCAMNSVANGKIRRMTPFRRVYVQPAAGDAGGAIGAAFAVWHKLGKPRSFRMEHACWGPQFDRDDIAALLAARRWQIAEAGCTVERIDDEAELCRSTAAAIAGGGVVGWFQGRMEWGPRALGNRSIVAHPGLPNMKDMLNARIKQREWFRPFAPSILAERQSEYFEHDHPSPFMLHVYKIRPEKRAQLCAVNHVDDTGRLQSVSRDENSLYYDLIQAFERKTGIPVILNTSFNENEPIVCKPEEAIDCFKRTRMDALAIGPYFVLKTDN